MSNQQPSLQRLAKIPGGVWVCVCVCAGVSMQYYEFYDDGEGPDEDSVPKDVNPVGYIAGGDLDFRKRPRPRYV